MNLKDKTRLIHIMKSINQINSYVSEQNHDRKTELAITRLIEIIGEAAKHLSEEFKKQHSSIPWRQITDTRNVIAHEYFGVDASALWKVAKINISDLGKRSTLY